MSTNGGVNVQLVAVAQRDTKAPPTVTRVAILGVGGLGKAAARIVGAKRTLRLVAACDSEGIVYDPAGLDCAA
ncbi:MAG: hypothetical protein HYZ89_06260, partial [Candidatus Omnitrophica bacterium]|nr:hypothetical protein [Candidatus Omnitrophota bacterium]